MSARRRQAAHLAWLQRYDRVEGSCGPVTWWTGGMAAGRAFSVGYAASAWVAYLGDDADEAGDIGSVEQRVGPVGTDVGEGRLVEAACVDDTSLGEVVPDEIHELDLVGRVALVVKEVGERILGGGAVEPDEPRDEELSLAGNCHRARPRAVSTMCPRSSRLDRFAQGDGSRVGTAARLARAAEAAMVDGSRGGARPRVPVDVQMPSGSPNPGERGRTSPRGWSTPRSSWVSTPGAASHTAGMALMPFMAVHTRPQ
jgi:hypothetical protein